MADVLTLPRVIDPERHFYSNSEIIDFESSKKNDERNSYTLQEKQPPALRKLNIGVVLKDVANGSETYYFEKGELTPYRIEIERHDCGDWTVFYGIAKWDGKEQSYRTHHLTRKPDGTIRREARVEWNNNVLDIQGKIQAHSTLDETVGATIFPFSDFQI